ncbi:MAG: hypothetical protein S4CHLAM45_06760 [Chlamydiales bacterium]|nr:hypothetical protein [Chlamydiales bacterium]MCH9620306.1 hypothetical protein [Chlamydiales bacterium]MCH9622783.1 hypothetical protein [Chlamydiales bacterium]
MMKYILLILFCSASLNLKAEEHYVVGIHGLALKSSSLNIVKRTLNCAKMDVYLWDYPSVDGTICDHAQSLVCCLQEIAECRPGKPIDFVTHSVGALVLRQALNVEGCPKEAKMGRAVLIAPPNQGSRLARETRWFAPIYACLGTKIGCELTHLTACDLDSLGQFPAEMDVLVIAGYQGNNLLFDEPNDGCVAVDETALNTPYYFEPIFARHGRLLSNQRVLNSTAHFIENGGGDREKCEARDACP